MEFFFFSAKYMFYFFLIIAQGDNDFTRFFLMSTLCILANTWTLAQCFSLLCALLQETGVGNF